MRFIQSNISAISNRIANQGIQLIVRIEAAGSRVAMSLHALMYGALHLISQLRGSSWQRPSTAWTSVVCVPVTVSRFVVKRRERQLVLDTRCRTLA